MVKQNSGISIIIVMAALVVVGFVGTALLKMSQSDNMGAVFYSNSETARLAAGSGLIAAINTISTADPIEKVTLLENLNSYMKAANPDTISDNSVLWLAGGPDTWMSLSANQEYRVKIDAFDTSNFTISLISEGKGVGDSRSTAVGVYELSGLGFDFDDSPLFLDALYLGQGAGEIVSQLKVLTGDVYVDNPKSYFTGTGAGTEHQFNGLFRTASGDDVMKIKNINFYGSALFRCPVELDGDPVWFHDGVGFERNINPGSRHVYVEGGTGAFLNGGYTGGAEVLTCGIKMNGLDIYGWSAKSYTAGMSNGLADISLNEGGAYPVADSMTDINDRLGITKQLPPKVGADLSVIPPELIHESRTIFGSHTVPDADDINTAYDTLPLWNDFLVLSGKSNAWNTFGHDGVLTVKIIWIMDDQGALHAPHNGMFSCGPNSIFLLYLNKSNVIDFRLGTTFRGLIFSNEPASSPRSVYFGTNNEVYGGIMIKNEIFRLQSDGGPFIIHYDQGIMNALSNLGIFYDEDGVVEPSGDRSIIYTEDRIRAVMLSNVI